MVCHESVSSAKDDRKLSGEGLSGKQHVCRLWGHLHGSPDKKHSPTSSMSKQRREETAQLVPVSHGCLQAEWQLSPPVPVSFSGLEMGFIRSSCSSSSGGRRRR